MSSINDGGPAFPSGPSGASFTGEDGMTTHQFSGCDGMSLRDYFAGQAMQGLLAFGHHQALIEAGAPDYQQAINGIALESYTYADAMLTARTTTKGGE